MKKMGKIFYDKNHILNLDQQVAAVLVFEEKNSNFWTFDIRFDWKIITLMLKMDWTKNQIEQFMMCG